MNIMSESSLIFFANVTTHNAKNARNSLSVLQTLKLFFLENARKNIITNTEKNECSMLSIL